MSRYEKALKLIPIMDVMQNRNTETSLEEVIILVELYVIGLLKISLIITEISNHFILINI